MRATEARATEAHVDVPSQKKLKSDHNSAPIHLYSFFFSFLH